MFAGIGRISLALQWTNLHIDVKSDCLEAVMIGGGIGNKPKYAFIIKEISSSMDERLIWTRGVLAMLIFVQALIMLVMSLLILVGCNAKLWFV